MGLNLQLSNHRSPGLTTIVLFKLCIQQHLHIYFKLVLHQKNTIVTLCWRPGHTWLCFMCFPCQSGTSNVLMNGPGAQESAHCVSHPHFVIHWCHKRPQDTKWWSYKRIYTFALKWSVEHFSGWSDVRVSFPALGEEDLGFILGGQ